MESVRVVIFGAEYQIKSDVDVETIRQIADLLIPGWQRSGKTQRFMTI
jgi:cell division protein ZapA (FtsZ GTPase activity inhibitor)